MSQLFVDNIKNKLGGAIEAPSGVVVTGVITATSFVGSAASLTGIDATALTDSGGNVKIQANTSGIVVTGVSTFSGNVSVGKTLTYEDVTNVDSVGVVTARAGIKLGVGQSISAVSGIVTYYGDGSQLSGVESGVANFVASGTIANGQTVIIKADGTVSTIGQTDVASTFGTDVDYVSTQTSVDSAAFDSTSGKVVIAYSNNDDNQHGYAIVGTVSGTSISFGSAVKFESAYIAHSTSVVFDSTNNRVVIVYRDMGNSSRGTAIVGTVSGTSISFGSASVFNSGNTGYPAATYDSGSGKIIICYRDYDNSNQGTAIVGTVSGTSISFGSESIFETGATTKPKAVYDSVNNKTVIVYSDGGDGSKGKAIVGTVSGTSISFGSAVVFNDASTTYFNAGYDSTNGKVVVAYAGSSNYGTARVGTVSGTSISFGTAVVYQSVIAWNPFVGFDSANGKVVISYRNVSIGNHGTIAVGSVSGTSISFGTPTVFEADSITPGDVVFDSTNNKIVIVYTDGGSPYQGKAIVVNTLGGLVTTLTTENYIGIAAEAISNGATGKVNVLGGVNTGQTGLTTAQTYYVQGNGTLATSAGSPSVVAGTSISYTKILIRQ